MDPMHASMVARIQSGDRAAEAELVGQYRQRVYLMAFVRLRDREHAADIAQESMIAALEAIRGGQLREPNRLSAFVHGIVRNLVNNFVRRLAKQPVSSLPDDPDQLPAVPHRNVEDDRTRLQTVRQLVERLEPMDRRILQLILFEGLNPGEIAVKLGVSGDQVRARKSRALKRIAQAMRLTPHAVNVP